MSSSADPWTEPRYVPQQLSRSEHAHQVAWVDPEPTRDLHNVVQRQVPLTTLHLTNERPVQAAGVSQGFLTESQLLPPRPDSPSELRRDG